MPGCEKEKEEEERAEILKLYSEHGALPSMEFAICGEIQLLFVEWYSQEFKTVT